jgi:PAS domain S-box-containing protein
MGDGGIIDFWNAGAKRMFGYDAGEVVGSHVRILFPPGDREGRVPERELERARRAGRSSDERRYLRKDGTHFFCNVVTTRLGGGGLGFATIARDLTAQRDHADALQQAHDDFEAGVRRRTTELRAEVEEHATAKLQVTQLVRRLVTAHEEQRARFARDLHDQLGQQLTALRLALERYQEKRGDSGRDLHEIGDALELLRQIGHDVEFLVWELRPRALDELGLAAALPRFVKEWSTHTGIAADFRANGFEAGQLSAEAEVTFYRVAQEALNNVAKHAQASRVDVVLAGNGDHVVLVIEDDGLGFERGDDYDGFGLAGMSERAALVGAILEIESSPGTGTSVFLRSPINLGGGDD